MSRYVRALFVISAFLVPAAAQPFTAWVKGPETVNAGSSIYVAVDTSLPLGARLTLVGVSSPFGGTSVIPDGDKKDEQGRNITWGGTGYPWVFRIVVPTAHPSGTYGVSLTISSGGANVTVQPTIRVVPAANPLPPAPYLASAPIPGIGKWQDTFNALGSKWCQTGTEPMSFGVEGQVWYYDGARVYFQLADYTQNKAWEQCALNIARQYRDYVVANKGSIIGNRIFTTGLRMAFERTGDPTFRDAVLMLAHQNSWSYNVQYAVPASQIRESAYILNAFIDAQKLGDKPHPNMSRYVDYLLGH
jgi:hypothetical protein